MEKKDPFNRVKKNPKTIEEASGRATEEGSLFQDGQIDVACTERVSNNTFTEHLIQIICKVSGNN